MAHGQYTQYIDDHTNNDENTLPSILLPRLLIQLHCTFFQVVGVPTSICNWSDRAI